MKVGSLIEIISAAHLSFYVESAFKERGGIMLVGPPASLKTAMSEVLDCYPNAWVLSDLTVKQGARMREDIASGRISTIAFADYAKLYQRQSAGAANVEGFIRALTAEGFRRANWEEPTMTVIPARALVIGCMTSSFYTQHWGSWKDDGFARRFLWSHFQLKDPNVIIEAIIKDVRLDFGGKNGFNPKLPTSKSIRGNITETESRLLLTFLRHQHGKEIGLILLKKILAALRWKFNREPERPMTIVQDFSRCLLREGAELEV